MKRLLLCNFNMWTTNLGFLTRLVFKIDHLLSLNLTVCGPGLQHKTYSSLNIDQMC